MIKAFINGVLTSLSRAFISAPAFIAFLAAAILFFSIAVISSSYRPFYGSIQ